jgi:hypothetical protein
VSTPAVWAPTSQGEDLKPITTTHAGLRAWQRGVPALVLNWLLDYGEETFDGRGGVLRYFTL